MNSLFTAITPTADFMRCLRYAVVGLLVASIPAPAQESHPFLTKTTIALFSADALVRTLDADSTLRNLNNPCKCFVESGIGFRSAPAQYSYSLGFVALEYGASYLLHRMHHDRLAILIPAYDLAYDGRTAIHNYTETPIVVRATGWVTAR
jgi:hypothetical protein